MSFKILLKNFRCLKQTDSLELRPITILLGRNSAGKSSFLRSFPLISQSLKTRASVPLMWFGEYVDFGGFDETKTRNIDDNYIQFEFETENLGIKPFYSRWRRLQAKDNNDKLLQGKQRLSIQVVKTNGTTHICKIEFYCGSLDQTLFLEIASTASRRLTKILLDDQPVSIPNVESIELADNDLFPDLKAIYSDNNYSEIGLHRPVLETIRALFKINAHKSLGPKKLEQFFRQFV